MCVCLYQLYVLISSVYNLCRDVSIKSGHVWEAPQLSLFIGQTQYWDTWDILSAGEKWTSLWVLLGMCMCVWPEINTESQTWWKTANFLQPDTSPTFKRTKPQKLNWNLPSLGWVLTLCSRAADSRFQLLQESPGATVTQILWPRRSQSSSLPSQKHLHRAGSFEGVP